MNKKVMNIVIVALLAASIIMTLISKQYQARARAQIAASEKMLIGHEGIGSAEKKLPLLLELGSVTCIPCKEMKPIIDELKLEYAGLLKIDFLDVKKDMEGTRKQYNWEYIPTQIFFDEDGKELFRHVGFYPKKAILAKWKELGIEFTEAK